MPLSIKNYIAVMYLIIYKYLMFRETGMFNSSVYGYNYVTRIPAGAASLEIR